MLYVPPVVVAAVELRQRYEAHCCQLQAARRPHLDMLPQPLPRQGAVVPPRRHALSVEAVKSIVTADDTLLVTHRRDREEWNRHVLMKAFGGTPGAVVDVGVVVTPFGLDQGSLAAFFERNKYWMELSLLPSTRS